MKKSKSKKDIQLTVAPSNVYSKSRDPQIVYHSSTLGGWDRGRNENINIIIILFTLSYCQAHNEHNHKEYYISKLVVPGKHRNFRHATLTNTDEKKSGPTPLIKIFKRQYTHFLCW